MDVTRGHEGCPQLQTRHRIRQRVLRDLQGLTAKDRPPNRLGAAIGEQQERIRERLAEFALNEDDPTDAELAQATTDVKEKFLARLFLLNSNKK